MALEQRKLTKDDIRETSLMRVRKNRQEEVEVSYGSICETPVLWLKVWRDGERVPKRSFTIPARIVPEVVRAMQRALEFVGTSERAPESR